MKRVVLDIGHGRNTFPPSKGVYLTENGLTGDRTGRWFEEHDFNSKVGEKVKQKLKDYDVEILYTQEPNADDVPLSKRVDLVKKWNKEYPIDLLVSIHANAHYPNSPANGFESYYWQGDIDGERFCRIWNREMKKVTGMTDRGVKISNAYKNSWYIVRNSPCTAVLLEHFFYTNYDELKRWSGEAGTEELAEVLFRVIVASLFLEKKKDKLKVSIQGIEHEFDYEVIDSQNYVPIRQIGETLGYTVAWDQETKKVMLS